MKCAHCGVDIVARSDGTYGSKRHPLLVLCHPLKNDTHTPAEPDDKKEHD